MPAMAADMGEWCDFEDRDNYQRNFDKDINLRQRSRWRLKTKLWLYEKVVLFQIITLLSIEPMFALLSTDKQDSATKTRLNA